MTLKPGQVLHHKCGQRMTVEKVNEDGTFETVWFDAFSKLQRHVWDIFDFPETFEDK